MRQALLVHPSGVPLRYPSTPNCPPWGEISGVLPLVAAETSWIWSFVLVEPVYGLIVVSEMEPLPL